MISITARSLLSAQRSSRTRRMEPLAELAGDRPGPARADDAAVALDHRDQLGGGAGQEALVGREDVVPVHRPLDRPCSPAARASSITASRVIPSRMPESIEGVWIAPVLDDEDVVAGALGDLALVVEHQGFEAAGLVPSILARMLFR